MAIYTFYPCRDDGSAATFEAFDLSGDDDTAPVAATVLVRHPSATFVSIYEADRRIGQIRRGPAASDLTQ